MNHEFARLQPGFTLIEILISLAISAVMLGGLIAVFSSNQNTARVMYSFGSQQENARAADDLLVHALRQAGHFGGVELSAIEVNSSLSLTGIGNCNQSWITNVGTPIQGYDGASILTDVLNLPSGCITASEYVANTDLLVIRYASTTDMSAIGSVDADTVYVRTIIAGGGSTVGEIFKGSDGTSIGGSTDPIGTYNYKYVTELYYIRSCSIKTSGSCQNSLPSLVKIELQDTSFTEEVLVEGVEQFQIEFGLDSDKDMTADQYASPSSVIDWSQIISVRFSLVVRGGDKDPTFQDTNSYSLVGGVSFTPATADREYRRRAYTKVVQLRNMNRS